MPTQAASELLRAAIGSSRSVVIGIDSELLNRDGAEMAERRRRAGHASGESQQVGPFTGEASGREGPTCRRSMAKRTSDVAAATSLDERERAALLALAEHKIFATDQILVMFCGSDRTAQRVLFDLREAGLIDSFEWRSKGKRDPDRHHLTPKGLKLAATLRGCRVAELGKVPTTEAAAKALMPHRRGVNRFFSDLVALTLERPGYGLETWRDEHKLKTPSGEVQPDSFGRLLHPGGAVEFYFEYDLGTEHRSVLIDKFARYQRIASTWDPLDGKSFPSVLFVCPKDARELELLRCAMRGVAHWDPKNAITARLPFYCTTVVRLRRHGQLGPVWRDMYASWDRLCLDKLPLVDASPYDLADCFGRRFTARVDA